jgi:hypothetical protein
LEIWSKFWKRKLGERKKKCMTSQDESKMMTDSNFTFWKKIHLLFSAGLQFSLVWEPFFVFCQIMENSYKIALHDWWTTITACSKRVRSNFDFFQRGFFWHFDQVLTIGLNNNVQICIKITSIFEFQVKNELFPNASSTTIYIELYLWERKFSCLTMN